LTSKFTTGALKLIFKRKSLVNIYAGKFPKNTYPLKIDESICEQSLIEIGKR